MTTNTAPVLSSFQVRYARALAAERGYPAARIARKLLAEYRVLFLHVSHEAMTEAVEAVLAD